MRMADYLTSEQKQLLNAIEKSKPTKLKSKNHNKRQECVDWVEIMGIRRDTYKRVHGKVRRK